MLAIFDVEGVLLDAEYLPVLAHEVKKEDKIWEITKKGIEGKIDWEMGLKQRIKLLRGLSFETCIKVADSLPLMPGAKTLCKTLKSAGWKIIAISGGFSIMTDRLKNILELDHVYSNELIFNDNLLDGVKIQVSSNKDKFAQIKASEWKQNRDDIVIIVDGANDVSLFSLCGLGIAFRGQDLIKKLATATLDEKNLSKIIDIINQHYSIKLPIKS